MKGNALRRIFLGDHGLRAGWSVLIFLSIYLLLDRVLTAAVRRVAWLHPTGPIPPGVALFSECGALLVVLFATWVMARIERRRVGSYGYRADDAITRLCWGGVWGFACLSALIGLLWKSGFLVFEGRPLDAGSAWGYAAAWAVVFLVVGLLEESLLRGYLQFTVSRGIGFWWAAVVLSVAFASWHLTNSGESLLGLLSAGAGGFTFCISLWYTKSLWWAIGFHAGWDWGQSFFYGTSDSGLVVTGHLLTARPVGPVLWSGGTVGPEGSLFLFPFLILLATGMWIWWGRLAKEG